MKRKSLKHVLCKKENGRIDPFHVRENVSKRGGQNKGNLVLWELNIISCYCFVLQFDFIYMNVKWSIHFPSDDVSFSNL